MRYSVDRRVTGPARPTMYHSTRPEFLTKCLLYIRFLVSVPVLLYHIFCEFCTFYECYLFYKFEYRRLLRYSAISMLAYAPKSHGWIGHRTLWACNRPQARLPYIDSVALAIHKMLSNIDQLQEFQVKHINHKQAAVLSFTV